MATITATELLMSTTSTFDNPAFVLKEKGKFEYKQHARPTLPSADHVIISVASTGLCGSDVHYWKHGQIGDFKVTAPLVLGHESSGVVEECGAGVKTLKTGDRVALEPGVPCRMCGYCRDGRYNLCADMRFAATPPYHGTLVKYYAIPADFCYRLPQHTSLEEGAVVEPLAVSVHCVKLGGVSFGSSVLVMGAGPIGLLCCAVARVLGASTVVATDIDDARLAFALKYAATAVYKTQSVGAAENAKKILVESQLEEGADVVIDATGVEMCIATGIHVLKRGGTFVQAGLGADMISFPVGQLCAKEGKFCGSFRYGPGDFEMAVELLRQGKVSVKELITHRFSFSEAEQAFVNVVQRKGIKTMISGPGRVS